MNWDVIADTVGLLFVLAGSLFALAGAVGLLRFGDLLTRMHAGTKPQVLSVLLVLAGVAISSKAILETGILILVAIFQMLTIPVGAHMVGRAALRNGQVQEAEEPTE